MKISDVLWVAANEKLWAGRKTTQNKQEWKYTCNAVYASRKGAERALEFIIELGCPNDSLDAFDEFETHEERQGARYLWLMFAYEVAKDEGK